MRILVNYNYPSGSVKRVERDEYKSGLLEEDRIIAPDIYEKIKEYLENQERKTA